MWWTFDELDQKLYASVHFLYSTKTFCSTIIETTMQMPLLLVYDTFIEKKTSQSEASAIVLFYCRYFLL
jgi:hypothetical protein